MLTAWLIQPKLVWDHSLKFVHWWNCLRSFQDFSPDANTINIHDYILTLFFTYLSNRTHIWMINIWSINIMCCTVLRNIYLIDFQCNWFSFQENFEIYHAVFLFLTVLSIVLQQGSAVKAPASKPKDLISIPEPYTVELFPETLSLTSSSIMACEHTTYLHTYVHDNAMKLQKTLQFYRDAY